MLAPKKVKWRKQQKGKMRGVSKGATSVVFGEYGLQSLTCGFVSARQIEAARIAIETAEALDARLESYSPTLLDEILAYNPRWVIRALHRGEHLDQVDAALKG